VPDDARRDVPDVALTASGFHDPYALITGGQFIPVGGTSAATPTFAGLLVLLNQYLTSTGFQSQPGLGNINANLYALAQAIPGVLHDITAGSNIVSCQPRSPNCPNGSFGYTAGPGYDQVTGLGSPDALNLVANWTALPALDIAKLTSDTSASLGGTINVGFTIANLGQADAGPFRVGVYLSTSPTSLSNQTIFAFCDFATLAAGAVSSCSGAVKLPAGLQPGKYYLIGVADVLNHVVQFYQFKSVHLSDSGPLIVAPANCTYSLSSSSAQVASSGGNISFTVDTQNGCSWSASSNVNWVTIASGSSGVGPAEVTLNVAANPGPARIAAISVATKQFTVNQSAYVPVTLQFTNNLIYPANISANGVVLGSVNGSGSASFTIAQPLTLQVSFELVRPAPFGTPLGDPMAGFYNTINSPVGVYSFTITNQIGNQTYFAPLVTNTTNSALLMDVNLGLAAENRCNCTVLPHGVDVAFGYYMLFSNSSVNAFGSTSGYTGTYYYFNNFTSAVEARTGILRLTFNQSP
jgi:hypothetical protein